LIYKSSQKRVAFTLVELVMVIIILGVLSSIAITRLSITKDDAEVVKMIDLINSAKSDIVSKSFSSGEIPVRFGDYSEIIKDLRDSGKMDPDTHYEVGFKTKDMNGSNLSCIIFKLVHGYKNTLQIYYNSNPNRGAICEAVKKVVKETNITLTGSTMF
jgi:prepilin-type N-terminal cleavage/methylation domain-containing protein